MKREAKSVHKMLEREGLPSFAWAFHGRDEIGPKMPSQSKRPGGGIEGG